MSTGRWQNVCYVAYGAQISSAAAGEFGRDRHMSTTGDGMQEPKRLYEGRDMRPFAIVDKGLWLDYRPEEMYGPRTRAFFSEALSAIRLRRERQLPRMG
jgi:hypothetical protein